MPIEYCMISSISSAKLLEHKYMYGPYTGFLYIWDMYMEAELLRGKLNSHFIVTKISILHAGGQSLFRFQTLTLIP